VGPQAISIVGTATPVDSAYGAGGAFVVSFPGTPGAECPGPNYIVQGKRMCNAVRFEILMIL
jgi:apolipoprotein D and lipocalin family protein